MLNHSQKQPRKEQQQLVTLKTACVEHSCHRSPLRGTRPNDEPLRRCSAERLLVPRASTRARHAMKDELLLQRRHEPPVRALLEKALQLPVTKAATLKASSEVSS